MFEARAERALPVAFVLDGKVMGEKRAPHRMPWRLSPGEHRLELVQGGERSAPITFTVR